MRRLLVDYKCDPNIRDAFNEYILLSYCTLKRKTQSLEMMISLCKNELNVNLLNFDKTTLLSWLVLNHDREYH